VAEPIDVALLSKGDGFARIKHKDFVAFSRSDPISTASP
jgi:hypothetical protein